MAHILTCSQTGTIRPARHAPSFLTPESGPSTLYSCACCQPNFAVSFYHRDRKTIINALYIAKVLQALPAKLEPSKTMFPVGPFRS